ncbi:MAG: quinolinate synthase NadA [Muribaculaceae bacterium]|nr:quinolinate synthase NadA [Muribaculaceae bacterium]
MSVDKSKDYKQQLKDEIIQLKKEKDAVILAHYYQQGEIQDVADFIGDSLALAQIARKLKEKTIVLCGVHFMGETAKILCPDKTVLIPDINAGCSLADSCDPVEFKKFIEDNPGHTVISYVNTSADIKAMTDVVVTSSNAKNIVDQFPEDEKIIFGPDKNLGNYINSITGRKMLLWNGACHVHEQFSVDKLIELKKQYPDAEVLAHPECKKPLLLLADVVGSTAALLKHSIESDCKQFIVATESGILHEMKKSSPEKEFIPLPGEDSTCGCNDCNFMKLNTLEKLRDCLKNGYPEIEVDVDIALKAVKPIERMLEMSK